MSDLAPAPPRSEISPSAFGFLERGLPPASGCAEWGYRRLAMTLLCISATFTAVLPIPICVDIIARMFFGMALDGIMEMETMALVVIVFFAMAYVTVSDGHIRIDLLTTLMPQRTQNRLIFFAHVMCAGISAAIAWQAGKTAWDWNELTPILNLPEWLFVMSTSVGLGMVSLGFCFQVRRSALTLIHDRDYFGLILALAVLGLLCSAPWLYKMSGVKVSGLVLGAWQ